MPSNVVGKIICWSSVLVRAGPVLFGGMEADLEVEHVTRRGRAVAQDMEAVAVVLSHELDAMCPPELEGKILVIHANWKVTQQ